MILTGKEIVRQISLGNIKISGFDERLVNPASVDLTLGDRVAVFREFTYDQTPARYPYDGIQLRPLWSREHDSKKPLAIDTYTIPREGWVLNPGVGYLMHTRERIQTNSFVPIIDGKSSIGRLFISVHETAAYGDPGFEGQFTLEVSVKFPIRVYAGMRICQIRFQRAEGEITSYQEKGHYRGRDAEGPVPSRIHETGFDMVEEEEDP